MRLEDLGEFGLIARLTRGLEQRPDVLLGVGDDAAVLAVPPGEDLVATCDAQVDGRHFLLGTATPEEIGHKALAVNLSDVAGMGAVPRWALISLLLPPGLSVETLEGIYGGMRALAREYAVALVGGNVASTSGPLTLDITLLGTVPHGKALTRAGAHPGDVLAVIGTLGAAAAGLLALVTAPERVVLASDIVQRVRQALFAPQPRVLAGRALAASGAATAMLDISDGLAGDLGHLCERSGVGAEVEVARLPIDPAATAVATAYGIGAVDLALFGGEDYGLVCAIRPEALEGAQAALRAVGSELQAIGRILPSDGGLRLRLEDGVVEPLVARGWDHLTAMDPGTAMEAEKGEQNAEGR